MPEAFDAHLVGMAGEGALDYNEDGDMDDGDASSVLSALWSLLVFTSQFTLLDTIVVIHVSSYMKSRSNLIEFVASIFLYVIPKFIINYQQPRDFRLTWQRFFHHNLQPAYY